VSCFRSSLSRDDRYHYGCLSVEKQISEQIDGLVQQQVAEELEKFIPQKLRNDVEKQKDELLVLEVELHNS
jgi:hypothetical protein